MRQFGIVGIVLLLACMMVLTSTDTLAQATRVVIKVEAMTPHRLGSMGTPDPGDHSYVSNGLTTVGPGYVVWLSAWDVTGDTAFKVGSSYNWVMTPAPGSAATLDSTTTQWTSFRPDTTGDYSVTVTVDGKDTSVVIKAANFIGVDRSSVSGAAFNCKSCHEGATPTIYTNWANSDHAKKFEFGMDGINGSYWGASCFPCHTTGFNTNVEAVNGGFDDVAATNGFNLSDSGAGGHWLPLRAGNYDSLAALTTGEQLVTMVAGITCENCHGPYRGGGGAGHQTKTLDPNMCGQCHDEPWRHNYQSMWENSGHAEPPFSGSFRGSPVNNNYTLNTCVRCHDGEAFIHFTKGEDFDNQTDYSIITRTEIVCATCHDPHNVSDATNHGLRATPTGSDTLANGYSYGSDNLGKAMICANCHKYRRDTDSYVATSSMSSHWGPHHAGATDVFTGQNAQTFGQTIQGSIGHKLITDACVGCHMSATPDTGTAARDKIGGHSWTMEWIDPQTQIEYNNVTKCVECHTGITKFDDIMASVDYDMDGTVEPFMHGEVAGLLDKVAESLPPIGSTTIDYAQIDANPADSAKFRKAYWNYLWVSEGAGHGAHNPKFVVGLLQATLNQLTGVEFVNNEIPTNFELAQNYPNPFNPTTEIRFSLPKQAPVVLQVYDMMGRVVTTLVSETLPAGNHKYAWNARGDNGETLSSGVYLYRIVAGNFVSTRKMVLLK